MPTEATAAVRESVNLEQLLADPNKANPLQLIGIDLDALTPEQTKSVAQALQARINDAVNGGLLVDKRTGLVYTGGTFISNVNRPVKAMAVIPSQFKAKEDHINRDGQVILPDGNVTKGHDALVVNVTGAIRFLLAGQTGNGINLVGQKEKTARGAAEAMGSIKGGLV